MRAAVRDAPTSQPVGSWWAAATDWRSWPTIAWVIVGLAVLTAFMWGLDYETARG